MVSTNEASDVRQQMYKPSKSYLQVEVASFDVQSMPDYRDEG